MPVQRKLKFINVGSLTSLLPPTSKTNVYVHVLANSIMTANAFAGRWSPREVLSRESMRKVCPPPPHLKLHPSLVFRHKSQAHPFRPAARKTVDWSAASSFLARNLQEKPLPHHCQAPRGNFCFTRKEWERISTSGGIVALKDNTSFHLLELQIYLQDKINF